MMRFKDRVEFCKKLPSWKSFWLNRLPRLREKQYNSNTKTDSAELRRNTQPIGSVGVFYLLLLNVISLAMVEESNRGDEVSGWKGISKVLGVSQRTAQDWERTLNLPVYRLEGQDKSRVWAYTSELTEWKKCKEATDRPSILSTPPVPDPSTGAVQTQKTTRRRWLRRYALIGGSAAAGSIGLELLVPRLWRELHQPASASRIEGATLVVYGRGNVELWRHTFPHQMYPEVDPLPELRRRFVDLDHDGRTETLFLNPSDFNRLYCFEKNGDIRWQFAPDRPQVIDNIGRSFVPPYVIWAFVVVNSPRQPFSNVVVTSPHHWSFANQVAVLDSKTGKVVSEYWHRGHLNAIAVADLSGHGHPEVLLGGVNDAPEYKRATLLVFSSDRIAGANQDPQGNPYFKGMDPGTEKVVVFFPKTAVSQTQEFNRVGEIRIGRDSITVFVAEGLDMVTSPRMIYEFDFSLRPIVAQMDGNLEQRYSELQAAGKLPKEPPYVIAERLLRQVTVIWAEK